MVERVLAISKALLLLVSVFPVVAIAQSLPLRQFQHTARTLQNSAPSQIDALVQTMDGDLWLGTLHGLFRFDGIRFEPYNPSSGQQRAHTNASLAIYLHPTFIQRWYFKAILGVVFVTGSWLLHLFRIKEERARAQARLYERFAERERIARDLHDTFFQDIQGLLLSVQSASRGLPEGNSTKSLLEEILIQSDGVMSQGRELVFNLRTHTRNPIDLGSALESAAMELSQHYTSEFHLTVVGEPRDISTNVCEELCELGREALCSAYRLARAQIIEVKIEYRADALRLAVSDDGIGISNETLAEGGVESYRGLPGMRERAAKMGATLRVLSSPGSGTIVQVDISSRLAYSSVARAKMRKLMGLFKARDLEG